MNYLDTVPLIFCLQNQVFRFEIERIHVSTALLFSSRCYWVGFMVMTAIYVGIDQFAAFTTVIPNPGMGYIHKDPKIYPNMISTHVFLVWFIAVIEDGSRDEFTRNR